MPLIVFLRGVNVGGHRTFRPSLLAQSLRAYDVQNIGAAGTFVVWKPGSQTKFREELLGKLPFDTQIVFCTARELARITIDNPFGPAPARPGVTRFVSVLAQGARPSLPLPITLPPRGKWLVRLLAQNRRFVFGEYRRDMKTIGYLGQIDKLFAGKATTRNWNTMTTIARTLKERG